MKIFHEGDLGEFLRNREGRMQAEIREEDPETVLTVNEDEYLDYLESEYKLQNLNVAFDDVYATTREESIKAEDHPRTFAVRSGESYKRPVYTFRIPFSGNRRLLRLRPSKYITTSVDVQVEEGEIKFDVVDFNDDAEKLNQKKDRKIDTIRRLSQNTIQEIEEFNESLRSKARAVFAKRRKQLEEQREKESELDVPVRRAEDTPKAVEVPVTTKKIEVEKPEPKISEDEAETKFRLRRGVYREILSVLFDIGREYEKQPSTYEGKSEEQLRDLFLPILESNFEGSGGGETFNKSGRTDILLNYEGENIFVAECKFWRGQSAHREAIDQLLDYLTWRDSRTALIYFVDRKSITEIVDKAHEATLDHPMCLKHENDEDGAWRNYRFGLPDDPDCPIDLALQLFHFPDG